jgi:hypothetical protein
VGANCNLERWQTRRWCGVRIKRNLLLRGNFVSLYGHCGGAVVQAEEMRKTRNKASRVVPTRPAPDQPYPPAVDNNELPLQRPECGIFLWKQKTRSKAFESDCLDRRSQREKTWSCSGVQCWQPLRSPTNLQPNVTRTVRQSIALRPRLSVSPSKQASSRHCPGPHFLRCGGVPREEGCHVTVDLSQAPSARGERLDQRGEDRRCMDHLPNEQACVGQLEGVNESTRRNRCLH